MKLSIIIVNYNVKFFLEQCLYSVQKACTKIQAEIFVVDNCSMDGSMAMVREKFPDVAVIENKENLGFSKANNQAIRKSKGEYVLLLNPDTVVEEDTFEKVIHFMDAHPDAGALGVKMIDGKGNFLPESKRALPTPWVSFYKVFGLSWLFPKSKKFGQYHLGYLDKDEINEVAILPGAFMLLRQKALDKAGLLDETFFMYGEDIDLSYRITEAGYKNYYFPETAIIHYKGESTKKSSVNYVLVFYQAMQIFANKHFSNRNAWLFNLTIHAAIYFRMFLAIMRRFFTKAFYPIMDVALAVLGLVLFNPLIESIKFTEGGSHPKEYLKIFIPIYVLIWVISIFFSGGYDKPYSFKRVFSGILTGSLIILATYALLPDNLRFSRLLILIGTGWNVMSFLPLRWVMPKLAGSTFETNIKKSKRVIVVATPEEFERISQLSKSIQLDLQIIGRVSPKPEPREEKALGSLDHLSEIIDINHIDEIIFSSTDLSTQQIIQTMLSLKDTRTDYKISSPESPSIIGSNSINTAGDLYVIDISSIATPANRRNKRLFDWVSSSVLLLLFPLYAVFIIRRISFWLPNLWAVWLGKKSWIGYYETDPELSYLLPKIRPGVWHPAVVSSNADAKRKHERNRQYAKDYHVLNDIQIFFKHIAGIL